MSPTVVMITPYTEPVVGGISSYVRGLADALRQVGVDVVVVANEGAEAPGVRVVGGPPSEFAKKAARLVREMQPKAVHAHAHWYALMAGILGTKRTDRNLVFTFHTAWEPVGLLRRHLLRRWLLQCDSLTFPTKFLFDQIGLGIPTRVARIIPPGTSMSQLDEATISRFREQLPLRSWEATLGYVGRFEWPKKVRGFRLLLEAMTKPGLGSAGLLVAGGGSLLSAVQSDVVRMGLGPRVCFLGDVRDPRLIYASCDVYCHPSLQEGMSLSVLEAMRYGVPVVGFRLGFMEETLEDGREGLLADPNSDSLARTLELLLNSPALQKQLGTAARKRAATQYDWGRIAQSFLELYGETS